ncbi:MAG TPA: NADH-quinone oxidoreductase subunit C [Thermoplasmata archaeon]|nr:NADH-quinone oxidoreductase subunit C [Thermoplasmata archaeon]
MKRKELDFIEILKNKFDSFNLNYKKIFTDRLELRLRAEQIPFVVRVLIQDFNARFITITCLDEGDVFELIYHFELVKEIFQGVLNLRVSIPKTSPAVPSLVKVTPLAEYIEREIQEFFGLRFSGNPRKENLILGKTSEEEGWTPPLLKEEREHFKKNILPVFASILSSGSSVPLSEKVRSFRENIGLSPFPPLVSLNEKEKEYHLQLVEKSGIYKFLPSLKKKY